MTKVEMRLLEEKAKSQKLAEALYEIIEWLDDCSMYGHESPMIQRSIEAMAAIGFDVIRFECNIENGKQALEDIGYNERRDSSAVCACGDELDAVEGQPGVLLPGV